MTFKEYVTELVEALKVKPEWADLPVVYSVDDEGNRYHKVNYTANPMSAEDPTAWEIELTEDGDKPNVICIN